MGLTRSGKARGAPTGTPEDPRGQGGVKQQSIRRQNEAANALAHARFKIEHTPRIQPLDGLKDSKDPDFRIEGRIFDCYSPAARRPRNPILEFFALPESEKKMVGKEARKLLALYSRARIEQQENGTFDEFDDDIDNTSIYPKYVEAVKDFMLAKIHGEIRDKVKSGQARNIVLNLTDSTCSPSEVRDYITQVPIEGLECVLTLRPKRGAKAAESYPTGSGSYSVFEPEDMLIEEFEFAQPSTPPLPHASDPAPQGGSQAAPSQGGAQPPPNANGSSTGGGTTG